VSPEPEDAVTDSATSARVRFVVVPFLPAQRPALGVSSLLSVLRKQDIAGDVRYLNLDYGKKLGWDFYEYLTSQLPTAFLPGEMIFTRALWHERAPDFAQYEQRISEWLERLSSRGGPGWKWPLTQWANYSKAMRAAIEEAPGVVAGWADEVLAGSPRVLGFTSTFQQSAAALALAREVRRRVPPEEVAILFGGANCEDDMGRALADNFDFIDCVVSGEGEEVIAGLVRQILEGGAPPPRYVQGAMVRDMDSLPVPDFDDYFTAARETSFGETRGWPRSRRAVAGGASNPTAPSAASTAGPWPSAARARRVSPPSWRRSARSTARPVSPSPTTSST